MIRSRRRRNNIRNKCEKCAKNTQNEEPAAKVAIDAFKICERRREKIATSPSMTHAFGGGAKCDPSEHYGSRNDPNSVYNYPIFEMSSVEYGCTILIEILN